VIGEGVRLKALISVGLIYAAPLIVLLVAILQWGHPFLTYTLDDPYIHLELARNLLAGNYGINSTEFSAPSSSILWPFLLAPLSPLPFYLYMPLAINAACLMATALLVHSRLQRLFANHVHSAVVGLFFLLSLNFYGVVFTGMEHSLHALLAVYIGLCLVDRDLREGSGPFFYAAVIANPLMRYEGLAISVPVLLYLMTVQSERVRALIAMGILGFGIGAFSLFLYMNSGDIIPSSVMSKQAATQADGLSSLLGSVRQSADAILTAYWWFFVPTLFLLLLHFRQSLLMFAGIVLSAALFVAFGRIGWFGRYEVFYMGFLGIMGIYAAAALPRGRIFLVVAMPLMPLAFGKLAAATYLTPLASSNIYNQQYLISQFVRDIDRNVAVNDLGLISYFSDTYVLDIWGLGNPTALKRKLAGDPTYIEDLSLKYGTDIFIVYPRWFSEDTFDDYVHVANLKLMERRVTPASAVVGIFARDAATADFLKRELLAFDFRENELSFQHY